ncbi:MAG: molybdate ABC transporter substrate-binding protein [Thiotrichales bacterium]
MKNTQITILGFFLANLWFAPLLCAETTKVAVAANFTDAARALSPVFEQTTGHHIKISYGSTGKLYSQIENGAPFDVFLAADLARPAKAEKDGLAIADSRFVYAKGKIVLWSADKASFTDGETFLNLKKFKRLALANPKTAPYGVAARQVMEKLGIWSDVQKQLVRGDTIAQAFQFTATANADVGFVAGSQYKAWKGDKGAVWEIPETYYEPISQAAVLLNKGADNPAAIAFYEFLKSTQAHEIIESFGYGI